MISFIVKRLKSFKYAFNGLLWALKTQGNLQFHFIAIVFVIAFGAYFNLSINEWLVVAVCIGMVVSAEIFNSAIEEIVNFISPNHHQKAGLIKDLAAAAVLVTAIIAAICGLVIFGSKILTFIS